MKISQIITFFFLIIPGLTFAQQDLQKDSFPKTIHYLSTTYLDNMQKVSNQTNNDLIHMSQDLSVSISIMLKQNVHTIQQSTSQLNHSITTQLLPEMKALREKVILMNHQVAKTFD